MTKSFDQLRIRRATARDVPTILKLIKDLAEYEHLSSQVTATAAKLRQHGFGRQRYFNALIASRERTAIGFALYFFTYSTFLAQPTLYVEDVFVVPEERGKGAGKALLTALGRIAIRSGCGRMELAVLDLYKPAKRF
jgi:GNAT superfamily N-acetyltransferase